MQKSVIPVIVLLGLAFSLWAQEAPSKNGTFRIDELILLPHPGRTVKMHNDRIGLTAEQQERIRKEIKAVYAPRFQDLMREAFTLEKKARRMVSKGAGKEQVKTLLDDIARLKRKSVDHRIDALNRFQEIVTPEQWKIILSLREGGRKATAVSQGKKETIVHPD